ncbi:hypothetical protein BDZ90DRAFT_276651 [Jaminaea rosea]|uniref:Uncharacterized protein n=1 Tax=Jaminaea rosea TaxID=1569628 RepID=A0A316UXY3_9BASI|nr:hypothetical protein BDZ90DRAFT_276651 [Jaminaea rosea]PWN30166.1 hypothetical protein BDZ90DRAFT_276651 [Jaminaea rosea]
MLFRLSLATIFTVFATLPRRFTAALPAELQVGRSIKDTCFSLNYVHCIRLRDPLAWRGDLSYSKGSSDDGEIENGGRIILYTVPTVGIYHGTCGGPGRVEFSFATGGYTATATAFGVLKAVLSDNPDQFSQHGRALFSKNGNGTDLVISC